MFFSFKHTSVKMSKDQAMTQKTRYVIDKNTLQMETFKDLFILQSFHCFSLK